MLYQTIHFIQYLADFTHSGIIFQLGYNFGHISNPFSLLFYPQRLDLLAPFHTMRPRIDIQNILKPQWGGGIGKKGT